MPVSSFLTLAQLVLPPPWDPLLALAVAAGLSLCGLWIARVAFENPRPLGIAAGFMAATAVLAAVAHGAALAGIALLAVSRALGWALAGLGVFTALAGLPRAWRWLRAGIPKAWRGLSCLERIGLVVSALTAVALILSALGPPTDADSLDYHLGAPMDWLRQGGYVPRPTWHNSRLTGLGEAVNMVGLASGTDVLGAVLAAASLIVAVIAVSDSAKEPGGVILAALLVASCPVAMFLVPNQKPQLLPAAALVVAVALLLKDWDRLDKGSIWLASCCISFAAACKYSSLFPATAAAVLLIVSARASGRAGLALGALALSGAVLAAPIFARNLVAYGDPISPFLERWKANPDPVVVGFATMLRNYGAEPSGEGTGTLLLNMFIPTSPGRYGMALGLGSIAAAVTRPRHRQGGLAVILAAGVVLCAVVLLGQRAGRYLVEPYLWCGLLAVETAANQARKVLTVGMLAQGFVTVLAAVSLAAMLVPGAVTAKGRTSIMARSALGYADWRWISSVAPSTPQGVLYGGRGRAFATRPLVDMDRLRYSAYPERELAALIEQSQAPTAVVAEPLSPEWLSIERACGARSTLSPLLELPVRNPWNRGITYRLRMIWLDRKRPTCSQWMASVLEGR